MINRKLALKVKAKHLAEEARIIRKEEKRSRGDTRDWLYLHRVHTVRPESRATNIAYAFAKGRELNQVEKYPERIPEEVWARVAKMVKLYSNKNSDEYKDWLSRAMAAQSGF